MFGVGVSGFRLEGQIAPTPNAEQNGITFVGYSVIHTRQGGVWITFFLPPPPIFQYPFSKEKGRKPKCKPKS